MRRIFAVAGVVALAIGLSTWAVNGPEDPAVPGFYTPADIVWQEGPSSLPPGAKIALLDGSPKNPDVFTARLKLPANYTIPPHYHMGVERVTVISGQLNVALGDSFDPARAKELVSGSFMKMPAKIHHFAFTKEETVIQLSTMGPWEIIYLNPTDDPRKK